MILFKKAEGLTKYLKTKSASGLQIGFVPTMGALHAGHLRLVQQCKTESDLVVASIFVNPTQFNDPQDFARYPVTLENDILLLAGAGTDILFLPAVAEIYPAGTAHLPRFDLGYLETILEGKYRPGHFQGVCQVMSRLLEIVMPARLFLGRKDYQQCMVIQKLVRLQDWPIAVTKVNTVREPSGLAMSSRNARLDNAGREKATAIYHSLQYLAASLHPGSLEALTAKAASAILESGFDNIDYVTIADASTLEPVSEWDGKRSLVALVAAFIQGVRLIDNLTLTKA